MKTFRLSLIAFLPLLNYGAFAEGEYITPDVFPSRMSLLFFLHV